MDGETAAKIVHAKTIDDLEKIRQLFREYEGFLGVDLCFQDFESELTELPGKYAAPHGALLMAVEGQDAAGCVAMRPLQELVCEMKRLYVKPQYRGRGLGKMLAKAVIDEAVIAGYSHMRLDTLNHLRRAIALYRSLGFRMIQPYYQNPLPDVLYWELELERRT